MVAGDLFVDIILSGFTVWPERGQESVARDYCREIGGGAAITASGLAKLGSHVGVLGVVGSDLGNWMVDRLRAAGIDTSGMSYDLSEPTAITVAVSDAQDRAFFTYPGANRLFPERLMDAANAKLLEHARHVHLACAPDSTPHASWCRRCIRTNARSPSMSDGTSHGLPIRGRWRSCRTSTSSSPMNTKRI